MNDFNHHHHHHHQHRHQTKQDIVDKFVNLGYDNNVVIDGIDNVNTRLSWDIDSECLIYSRSKETWFKGVIIEIFTDSSTNQEWLVIRYNGRKKKKIQRFCVDIKPNDSDDNADKFKVKQIVNYAKVINKINYQETRITLCVYGFTRMYCGSINIPPDIQQLCLFIYTKLYITIDEKIKNSTLTITFLKKPMGYTIYRGEDDKNAWISDIRDDNVYKKNGLQIGLYIHTVNGVIVDNDPYYSILSHVRDILAPITIGFNSYPPLNPNDIHVENLQRLGNTFNELQYAWQQLNKVFDTMTTQHPNFESEMIQMLSQLSLL